MKKITKKQARTIIEKTMASFGLQNDMRTDPHTMKSVFEELTLDTFKTNDSRMNALLRDAVSRPQSFQPLLHAIKEGIVAKHPALIEFADLALKKQWFGESRHVIRALHVVFILEALTAAMCNSHGFFIEVHDHYKAQERLRGINTQHALSAFIHALKISHHFFGTVKAFSVDPAMMYLRIQRGLSDSSLEKDEIKKLRMDKKINFLEGKLLSPLRKDGLSRINELLRINIYEAGITDYKKGLEANALCAHELSENIKNNPPRAYFINKHVVPENSTNAFYRSMSKTKNRFPVVELSQDWVSLYVTWNMAFILNNLDDLDILLPKLLIPSLLHAESGNFIGVRIISLWLSANHVFFRKYEKKEVIGPKQKYQMAKAWGEINKKYAFDLAKREAHENPKTLMQTYSGFFSHPLCNFFKLVKIFIS